MICDFLYSYLETGQERSGRSIPAGAPNTCIQVYFCDMIAASGQVDMKYSLFVRRNACKIALFAIPFLLLPGQSSLVQWTRWSSRSGELPAPGTSREQTGVLAAHLDRDSPATDFVMSFRVVGPALVWYRRIPTGWSRSVIEPEFLTIEAGGAAYDIDGDGDTDIVFGNDWQGNKLWWWENPSPNFDPAVPWKRHLIKDGGANQHHDQVFADIKGTGKAQLVFWNQGAKAIYLADIPADPRHTEPWPYVEIFNGKAGEGENGAALYAEGMDAYDIDGDGKLDLLAGNYWFHHEGGNVFRPIRIAPMGGRIRAGRFKNSRYPQIVIAPGDGSGPLMMYECEGNPLKSSDWHGKKLLDRDMIHGHTLELGDVNGDGKLDILAAEQGKWNRGPQPLDNPEATAWILYGDGKGGFTTTILDKHEGWHDGKLADFDGDGDLDVLQKPYAWDAPRVDLWLNHGTGHVPKWTPRHAATLKVQPFLQPVGMELWTYREELKRDLPATLRLIRTLGFQTVETASFYGHSAAEFKKLLDEAGLRCTSLIASYDQLQKAMPAVIADAQTLGVSYVLASWIPHSGALTEEQIHHAASDFNNWGEQLRGANLQFGYHPHGFEFVPTPTETLFDVLARETNPQLVFFEMDTFWFAQAGADPVAYLERYPNRFRLLHLKDMARGTKRDTSGSAPEQASVALGQGQLRWSEILRQAARSGVSGYFIEDESPRAVAQVPLTLAYLKAIRY
jgi:sugar phosphate isomerase/epimerase